MVNPLNPYAPGLTIPNTPPASNANPSDLIWIWQNGLLLSCPVSLLTAGFTIKGTLTLTASSTTSTISINGVLPSSTPVLTPKTISARANIPAVTPGTNQLVLSHGSNPAVDQTFYYSIFI